MDIPIVFQVLGYVISGIATVYIMILRRRLIHLQFKSEKAKASYYRSRKKAEDMRKNRDLVETGKTIWDFISGNRKNNSGEYA